MSRPGLALLAALILLAGCAPTGPRPASKATFRPYSIGGKTYRPLMTAHGYREEGYASWYEPGWFSGKTTANGERLDPDALTCAHKLLPINTMLRVRNLENGREVVVRVNDRGPFVAGRCVDLTEAGARALGFYGRGKARVALAVDGPPPAQGVAPAPPPAGSPPAQPGQATVPDWQFFGPFYVQVGVFAVRENAHNLARRLTDMGYAGTTVQEADQSGQRVWRVQAGDFASLGEAMEAQDRLAGRFPDAFVVSRQ